MRRRKQFPEPEYVIICSATVDWKSQAEMVASLQKPMLLLGACDPEFVDDLRIKHRLSCKIEKPEKTLLWNPEREGVHC